MKASELRDKTPEALKADLLDLKKEQLNLRFQQANQILEKSARVREVRRDIARIKTVLMEKTSAGNSGKEAS